MKMALADMEAIWLKKVRTGCMGIIWLEEVGIGRYEDSTDRYEISTVGYGVNLTQVSGHRLYKVDTGCYGISYGRNK
jgi:hypothetical protein